MITEDGTLSYHLEPAPGRLFANQLRHVANPVLGVICGLVGGGALFLVAVQELFKVRPSLIALLVLVAAVVTYLGAALRARWVTRATAYQVILAEDGITQIGAGLPASGTHPWTRFTRWLERDDEFVVVAGGWRARLVITLPKGDIPEDEQELLREVLHAEIDPDDESISEAFAEMGWNEQPPRRDRA